MNKNDLKITFGKDTLIEAEILSTWGPFFEIGESNQEIFTLTQSIIYKLQQSHYHLIQALRYSDLSIKELSKGLSRDRQYYNFVTNCNFDSMIYALNSIQDVVTKVIKEIYPEIKLKCKDCKGFKKKSKFLTLIKEFDPNTADIIQSFLNLEESKYVRKYCNENKHDRAFFSAGSYMDFDIGNKEIKKGYNLKNKYNGEHDGKNLQDYAQQIFDQNLEKICELGKSILKHKGLEAIPVEENFMEQIQMMTNKYYR